MTNSTRLVLNGSKGKGCDFWDGGCTVYEARPIQCSSFPWWNIIIGNEAVWNKTKEYCQGIGHGKLHTAEHIESVMHGHNKESCVSK